MSQQETCPKCSGPMTDVSKDGTYAYAHAPNGVICLARQVAAEREAHAVTQAKLAHLQAIVDRLNDNDLADRVMVRCNDPAHDERWCGTCEARGEGIDAYRLAVLNAAAAKEK